MDRSVFSDWVFAEKNRVDGTIDASGFEYYMHLRQKMLDGLPVPNMTVYLDVSAQNCYDRVHNLRGRVCARSWTPTHFCRNANLEFHWHILRVWMNVMHDF